MIAERVRPQVIAYEIDFDRKKGLKETYLSKQIDAYIGERLNVLLNKSKYEIKNNLLYGEDVNEPFMCVIKRGVDYKEKAEGKDRADKKREEAELEGFGKIQEIMCNPDTQEGTMVLSVSPKGGVSSSYERNFYDIFTLKEAYGKRFIEARRYSSALGIDEYKDKLKPLASMKYIIDDADFLKNPIKIDNVFFESADQVHSYLHRNHKTMNIEEFERIMLSCQGLKREYFENPDPKILDAIKNKADEMAGLNHYDNTYYYSDLLKSTTSLNTMTVSQEIDFYGERKVREVATGCGSSGSSSKRTFDNGLRFSSPFSVSEFGLSEDQYGERTFECPECGKTNVRPENELIKNCQHCGSSKVAC